MRKIYFYPFIQPVIIKLLHDVAKIICLLIPVDW